MNPACIQNPQMVQRLAMVVRILLSKPMTAIADYVSILVVDEMNHNGVAKLKDVGGM